MLKTGLTAKSKGATVESLNKPTEGSGPRATLYPFLSVEYVGSSVVQLDKATLADPKSCPTIGITSHLGCLGRGIAQSECVRQSFVEGGA